MCCFFIVIKLLILKILLAGLTGFSAAARYDYGYHPSAEEFDNLLRETQRTWTHSFLKAERDRLLKSPIEPHFKAAEDHTKTDARYFVPKFQYENSEAIKINGYKPTLLPHQNKPLQNVDSSLEFNYFSDEVSKPLNNNPSLPDTYNESLKDMRPVSSAGPEISLKPLASPGTFSSQKYSLNHLHRNNSQAYFPIYFTNPATGIVYAITEVGKSSQNVTKSNGSIPIFITKEQYERDMSQIKNLYQQKCQNFRFDTTPRPTIIRLQNQPASILPITSSKFSPTSNTPRPLHKPSPVVVKTELTVKDTKPSIVIRPLRKKKKKLKPKHKTKKLSSTGHKMLPTTIRPILENQPEGPKIIIGTRTLTENPYKNHEKLPTQLEKPNLDIFSGTALPQKMEVKGDAGEPNLLSNNHRINRRSLEKKSQNVYMPWKAESLQNYYSEILKIPYFKNTEKIVLKNSSVTETTKLLQDFKINSLHINSSEMQVVPKELIRKNLPENSIKEKEFYNGNISQKIKHKILENYSKSFESADENPKEFVQILNKTNSELKRDQDLFKSKENLFQVLKLSVNTDHQKNESVFDFQKQYNLNIFNITHLTSHLNKSSLNNELLILNSHSNFQNILKTLNHKEPLKAIESKRDFDNTNSSMEGSFFVDFKHHINKRSTDNFTKNNFTLSKFIKKYNETQMDSKNFTETKSIVQNQNFTRPSEKNSNLKESAKNRNTNIHGNGSGNRRILKRLKKRKRLSKLKVAPRTVKPSGIKAQTHKSKKIQKKFKGKQHEEYFDYGEADDESDDEEYEGDDDDDDDDDVDDDVDEKEDKYVDEEEEGEEEYQDQNEIVAYDDELYETHTLEAGLSAEDLSEASTDETNSSSQKEIENSVLKKVSVKNSFLDHDNVDEIVLKPNPTYVKKRFRRRPPPRRRIEDYDDDVDDDSSISSNLAEFFRMIFYPIQVVMSSVMDSFSGKDADEEDDSPNFSPYTQYTPYHKTLKQHSIDEYDDDYDSNESGGNTLSNWFSSWFAFNRRNKKISSTTVAPVKLKPTKTSSSWLPSWLGFGANDRISTGTASNEDYDEYDKWFASWFGEMKPKARRRTTTTTSTTTQLPHVPILTIVDPMKNPQNWIGILAHHIINHTSSSTANPLKDVWNRVTSTTTEDPEIPRKISYDKYQIWRLKPQDDSQVKALEEYKKSEDGIKLQWLKGPSLRGLTDVLVPPKMLLDFQASLTFELIDHEVLIFDVGKAIAYEKSKEDYFFTTTQKPKKHHGKNPSAIASMTWHKYYEYDDIVKYLETMRMRFPHLVDLIHIGRSYEGRPLIIMKIESKEAAAVNSEHYPAHQRNKLRHKKRIGLANAVFIEAGTHGMEWIGPATATWIINELLRIMKKNVTDDQSFIRNTTWYIMPVLNPDGYVYSHEFDRFWKKSRSRHITRPSGILSSAMTWLQKKRTKEKICFGVDLDRNWHYQWGRRGSSKSACNEFYAGPAPFSEPETKALSEFLMDYRTHIKLFVSMQSYGQIISYPYKANTTYDSERLDDLLDVAMVGTDGLRKKGSKSRYKVDSSNDLVENRSGCSDAFAAYEAGIPFSYTLQLADNGVHGYLLPSASIESTAKDTFEIISGMLDYI